MIFTVFSPSFKALVDSKDLVIDSCKIPYVVDCFSIILGSVQLQRSASRLL